MRRHLLFSIVALALAIFARVTCAQQATPPAGGRGSVDVRLKLSGGEKFSGVATMRVLASAGAVVAEGKEGIGGLGHFAGLAVGRYSVEVKAPGFVTENHEIEISNGEPATTIFLIMTPEGSHATADMGAAPSTELAATTRQQAEKAMQALQHDDAVPPVRPNVACPLDLVLQGVGQRVQELVTNLDRFSATERVEHFALHGNGEVTAPEARSFDYVVVVTHNGDKDFYIDEYRNGDVDPSRFPAGIATTGLPALALIFHPNFAPEFKLVCEGLGESGGRPAWQVHFEQRADRPNQIRSYIVHQNAYSVPLQGRVMIDAGTFQVLRLESELVSPVPSIKLMQERIAIDYALVQFRSEGQQLWLPQTAEIYVERHGNRYYRRHTFTNFQVFTVGTEQKVHPPKESYAFTNTSDREISGVLTLFPIPGRALHEVSITFRIPAGKTVLKAVGPGKDVNFPVEAVESARFAHSGPPGSIDANAYFVNASTLELVPDTAVPAAQ